jgi:hypothetical protein
MSPRSGYQPLAQSVDEADEEADVGQVNQSDPDRPLTPTRAQRRAARPGSVDLNKLDKAFKRYVDVLFGCFSQAYHTPLTGGQNQ